MAGAGSRLDWGLARLAGWACMLASACTVAACGVTATDVADIGGFALNTESLVWRLDPPDGGEPSYVVGTIHLVDGRLEPQIAQAMELLNEAGALVVEVETAGDPAAAPRRMLTDGRVLPDLIGIDAYARLVDIVEPYGVPDTTLRHFQPWAAALLISFPPQRDEQSGSEPSGATTASFDQRLIDAAEAWHLPVDGLESVAEQQAVFADLPEADQVRMLLSTMDGRGQPDTSLEDMLDAYLAHDLGSAVAVSFASFASVGDAGTTDRIVDRLLVRRNHVMADRLIPLLAVGPRLVAIGALHLPGEEGVLNLLTGQGWTVTPLS